MNKKVLNLYSGIGGNRKPWENVDVTAVEINPKIAKIYQDFYPDDTVVVTDAQEYLLKHYDDGWDFIWASPPCQSHSRIRNAGVGHGQNKPIYPDMSLYEIILFLQNVFRLGGCKFDGKYCVENVISFYKPLIKPQNVGRHYFWTNFYIPKKKIAPTPEKVRGKLNGLEDYYGMKVSDIDGKDRKMLRSCVDPNLAKYLFDTAFKYKQNNLFDQKRR